MKLRGFFFLLPILCLCQELVVSEITHKGNTLTKDYIITREIQHPVGVPLDSVIAIEDQNRLINLGIFADIKWRAIPLENKTVRLEYEILENANFIGGRFFGGPSPAYDEETGWSFGVGGVFKNFRGRNEQIAGGFMVGGRNTFGIGFTNPWITGDHVSLSMNMGKGEYNHPYLPYTVQIKTVELNVGKYFGEKRKTFIGFEIEDMDFLNDSTQLNYQYFAPQGTFIYDSRDLYANPTKGILLKQAFMGRIDIKGEVENNFTWFQSYSFYKRLSSLHNSRPWILAAGVKAMMSFGEQDHHFMGAMGESGSVRGWHYPTHINYNDPEQSYRFGFHNLKSSVELRKVIVPRIPLKNLYEFGVTVSTFIDWGVTSQDKFEDLLRLRPVLGTGVSLQFQVPFVPVLRLEYGWGFYDGKQMDRAFHLAVAHQI